MKKIINADDHDVSSLIKFVEIEYLDIFKLIVFSKRVCFWVAKYDKQIKKIEIA